MLPNIKVQNLISKHTELEKELSSGEVDKKNFAEKSKEYSELNEIINEAKEYIVFEKTKSELEKIINDIEGEKDIIVKLNGEQVVFEYNSYQNKIRYPLKYNLLI